MGHRHGKGIILSNRHIAFEVALPRDCFGDFVNEFNDLFAIPDVHGGNVGKTIDSYDIHTVAVRINLTVVKNDREKFLKFVEDFCKRKKIPLHDKTSS